jgi:hypothetical protein
MDGSALQPRVCYTAHYDTTSAGTGTGTATAALLDRPVPAHASASGLGHIYYRRYLHLVEWRAQRDLIILSLHQN